MANRLEFTRKTRASAFERSKGICDGCQATLKAGGAEYDHVLPAALGGDNSLANCQVLCRVCHVEKSAIDIRSIRKADRVRDKSTRAVVPKQKIRSQGFAVSEKAAARQTKVPLPPRQLYREELS
jgi:5-methylcytosine-specific restriction enzyme A